MQTKTSAFVGLISTMSHLSTTKPEVLDMTAVAEKLLKLGLEPTDGGTFQPFSDEQVAAVETVGV